MPYEIEGKTYYSIVEVSRLVGVPDETIIGWIRPPIAQWPKLRCGSRCRQQSVFCLSRYRARITAPQQFCIHRSHHFLALLHESLFLFRPGEVTN